MKDFYDKYSFVFLIVLILLLVFTSHIDKNRTESLQEKYDLLEEKYNDLENIYSETIYNCEDPLAVLYCYFEDEGITFDEARDAFNVINEQICQFY